jgi:carbamoyl-phosphate synthase small subunit
MKYTEKKPAVLVLEDGTVFQGKAAGAIGTTSGEICFNTGMTGYQEIFTDPSYYGQILVATHVHIGNYGIHATEIESENIKIAGLVCRSFNVQYSRKNAQSSIEEYFKCSFFVNSNIIPFSPLSYPLKFPFHLMSLPISQSE